MRLNIVRTTANEFRAGHGRLPAERDRRGDSHPDDVSPRLRDGWPAAAEVPAEPAGVQRVLFAYTVFRSAPTQGPAGLILRRLCAVVCALAEGGEEFRDLPRPPPPPRGQEGRFLRRLAAVFGALAEGGEESRALPRRPPPLVATGGRRRRT